MTALADVPARLEYLRAQINAECISYNELAELQGLFAHIAPDDVQLLEWAGVLEHMTAEQVQADYERYGHIAAWRYDDA